MKTLLRRSQNNCFTDETALAASRPRPRTLHPAPPPPRLFPGNRKVFIFKHCEEVCVKKETCRPTITLMHHFNSNLLHGRKTRSWSHLLKQAESGKKECCLVLRYLCMPLLGDEHLIPGWELHILMFTVVDHTKCLNRRW